MGVSPEQERQEESICLDKIIGHISFEIYHLSFCREADGQQMANDKFQMIYDQ
jgi:hypothetical protein